MLLRYLAHPGRYILDRRIMCEIKMPTTLLTLYRLCMHHPVVSLCLLALCIVGARRH